jgi:cardiolipin synthase
LILLGVIVLYINNLKLDIKPSLISKITTCLQFITVIAVLSNGYVRFISDFIIYLYYITALFTIISGLHYMHYWFKMMGESMDNG